jgi:hypothetical protein
VTSESASFPEFQSGRFAVLMVDIRYHVTVVDDPTVAAAKRMFDLIDAIPKIAKKHGGKALARAWEEMIYLWASSDGVVNTSLGAAMSEIVSTIRRVKTDESSRPPMYLVASEGVFFYQLHHGTFINLLGPGMKRVGALAQSARSGNAVAMVDAAISQACPDLVWTPRPDGVFVLE